MTSSFYILTKHYFAFLKFNYFRYSLPISMPQHSCSFNGKKPAHCVLDFYKHPTRDKSGMSRAIHFWTSVPHGAKVSRSWRQVLHSPSLGFPAFIHQGPPLDPILACDTYRIISQSQTGGCRSALGFHELSQGRRASCGLLRISPPAVFEDFLVAFPSSHFFRQVLESTTSRHHG